MRAIAVPSLRPLAAALLLLPAGAALAMQADDEPFDLYAELDAESVPGGGDDAGFADFAAKVDPAKGEICYSLTVEDVDMTAAHIHEGKAGESGPPVFTLEALGDDGEPVCAPIEAKLMRALSSRPKSHYVNVHTAEYPGGALRGQLEN